MAQACSSPFLDTSDIVWCNGRAKDAEHESTSLSIVLLVICREMHEQIASCLGWVWSSTDSRDHTNTIRAGSEHFRELSSLDTANSQNGNWTVDNRLT